MWPFHKHKWVEENRQYFRKTTDWYYIEDGKRFYITEGATRVTLKCESCGKYKQIELRGDLAQ